MSAKQRAVPAVRFWGAISYKVRQKTAPDGIPLDSIRRFFLLNLNRFQILVLRTSSSLTSPSRSLHRRIMSCRKSSFMPLLIQLMI